MHQPCLRWFALAVYLLTPVGASAQKLVTAGGPGTSPAVRVFDASGTDTTFLAYPAAFPGGVRVALGDVTGDGVLDIITGAGPGGGPHVRVWDGTDLTEVGGFFAYNPAFSGGVFVAAGDVNGDGKADIITGAGAGGGPHVRIWDGATFTEIGGFFAYDPAFPGGVTVAAGDVNGDGLADIITGAGPSGGPHVRVWNGATLTELGGFFAYDPAFPGGVNVAAGDVNGDGLADIITGAGPGGGPHVRVWNGATFAELGGFFAYDPAFPGGVVVGTVDLDRDGRNELITGPATGSPLIRLWTGTTFMLFGEYFAYDPALGGNGVFVGSVASNPSTDDAPRVASTVPANNATDVPVDADLTVTFSEPVTAGVGAFVLECAGGAPIFLTNSGLPATTFTLSPPSPLPQSTACTLRIVKSQIADEDTDDPPDAMTADVTVSFTTSACTLITVGPTTVPGGTVNLAYAPVTFFPTGGTPPFTWSITSGTLPMGMNLSAAGVLSGTPTQAGAFPLTITATASGGCTGSVSLTLNIASGPNVAPSFTVGPNTAVLEDAGAQSVANWATAISPGPTPGEAGQVVTFNITGNTNPSLFSAAPAVSPTGTLTYTPAANANGTATITLVLMDNGGTALGGVDTSAPQTFTITVTAVNDVPSFAVGPNQTVAENAGPQTVAGWALAISSGPANESAQTLTFNITGNTNAALFSAGPAVSPTGTLTYTPAANGNGTATITLALQDNGGTANGGDDTSPSLTFTITVAGVNSAPSFTVGPNQTVLEDAGAQTATPWATAISPGPPDEASQLVTFTITGNTNAALFSIAPAVSPTGTLTYTPAANAVGTATITLTLSDDGGTANGGVDTSAPQTFTITVTAVNDAPSFTKGADQTAVENSGAHTVAGWATAISAGPADEAGQTLTFNVTGNTNTALFSAGPAVSSTGTLTYTLAPGVAGAATVTLTLSDNGGTANGGVDTSAPPQTFTITVTGVNTAPSFTIGANQTVLEDAGPQAIANWATNIDPGGPDEAGQTLQFNVTGNTNPALFNAGPVVSSTGTLIYALAFNSSGTATITLTLSDNGGTAGGGVDTSAPQTFTITVTAVNDAPSFTPGANPTSAEDAGPQTVNPWATAISAGPSDEAGQMLTFMVTGNTNAALFSTQPAVSAAGVLTYTSAPNAFGTATITLALQDNGGTANGGVNTSAPVTFTITVLPVNDAPVVAGETFAVLGNTELRVDLSPGTTPHTTETTPNPNAVLGVLDNDADPESDPFAVTAITGCADATAPFDCTLANGAVIHVEATGAFSYTPAPGATTGSFTYTVTDTPAQGTAGSVTATVTFTIAEMVWYVKNDGPAGNGTSISPLNSLATLNGAGGTGDVDDVNDYIFVDFGSGTNTGQDAGLELEIGQHLLGEFMGLSIPVNLNGNGAPTVLVPTPTATACSGGPCRPLISNTAGNAVTLTEAMPAEVRGFRLVGGSAGNAIDLTTDAALTGSSSLLISLNVFQGAGQEGLDVTMGAGTTGTLTLNVTANAWDNAAAHTANAVDIIHTAGAGTLNLDFSNNTNIESAVNAVVVDGGSVASTNITAFANNTVHTDTLGAGVVITNATFDAVPGGGFDQVDGDALTIGLDGNGVGGPGMTLTTVRGNLRFDDLDVYGGTTGLTVTGDAAGFVFGVVAPASGGSSEVKGANGATVTVTNAVLDLQLAELASTASAGSGVSLTTVSGTFSAPTGSTIVKNGGGGAAFSLNNSAAGTTVLSATYGGTIVNASGTGGSVLVNTADAGSTVSFTGAITDNPGTGIALTTNTGATVNFSGGMTLNGASSRFAATGGGTVNVTGTNTIGATTPPTGLALNVANTTIGVSGMTFRTISSNGGANGIVLNSTGATAGLTVVGNGGSCTPGTPTCSGGRIQNTTGADDSGTTPIGTGIVLNNTSNVSLALMRLDNHSNYAIRGTSVNGFTLANSLVDGANGSNVATPFNDGSLVFFGVTGVSSGMTGTSSITNCTIQGGFQRNIAIDNSVGTLNLTVSGNTIRRTSDAAGDDGFFLEADTTANVTVAITNNTFARHGGDHINLSLVNNAVVDATITGNTLHGNYTGTPEGNHPIGLGQGIFILGATFNGTFTYEVSNNGTVAVPFRGNRQGGAIHVNKGSGTGTFSGSIESNVIGDPAVVGSGSSEAFGIIVGARGAGGSHTTLINNNQVRQYFDRGIVLEAGEGSAALNATVTNNTLSNFADAINSLHGIHSDNGILAADNNVVCLNISGNSVATAGNEPQGGADIRLRRGSNTTVRIPGLSGTTSADAQARLQALNPTATTITVTGTAFSNIAACQIP